jgi:carbamoyltransferase
MGTEIDVLAVGNCFLRKEDQSTALKQQYENKFTPD